MNVIVRGLWNVIYDHDVMCLSDIALASWLTQIALTKQINQYIVCFSKSILCRFASFLLADVCSTAYLFSSVVLQWLFEGLMIF